MSALSSADLRSMWKSIADTNYTEPFEGADGLEAYEQMFEQLARVSAAIDTATQGIYSQAHSSQSALPAGLASPAYVVLDLSRNLRMDISLQLPTETLGFEEVAHDWGQDIGERGQLLPTGRVYAPVPGTVFMGGDSGPFRFAAKSRGVGYGFNNPQIGSITKVNSARSVAGSGASVINSGVTDTLAILANSQEMPGPAHVGHYLTFTHGSNVGRVRRILAIAGSNLILECPYQARGVWVGDSTIGEVLWMGSYSVKLLGMASEECFGVEMSPRPGNSSGVFTGSLSGSTFTESNVSDSSHLSPEVGTANWVTLSFETDFGFTVTNKMQPIMGAAGVLEEIGRERRVYQMQGEAQEEYRKRVVNLPDVVSPNAIKRIVNRQIVPLGKTAILREPGTANLPGFFYDVDAYDYGSQSVIGEVSGLLSNEPVYQVNDDTGVVVSGYACVNFDSNYLVCITGQSGLFSRDWPIIGKKSHGKATTRYPINGGLAEANRYRYYFNEQESVRFFLVTFPPLSGGKIFAYDAINNANAYDLLTSESHNFYDGIDAAYRLRLKTIWKSINAARAAGVSFDLAIDIINLDLDPDSDTYTRPPT